MFLMSLIDRENRNRNRKSRWGNVSPSSMADEAADSERPEGEKRPRRQSTEQFEAGEHNSSKFNESVNDERPPGTENESFDDAKFNAPKPLPHEPNESINDEKTTKCFETPIIEQSDESFAPTNQTQDFEPANNENFESATNQDNFQPPESTAVNEKFEPPPPPPSEPQMVNEVCPPRESNEQFFEPEPQMEMKADFPIEEQQPEREAVSECVVSEGPCEQQEQEQSSL